MSRRQANRYPDNRGRLWVWRFALYSCELSDTRTHPTRTSAHRACKIVRYSALIPFIPAHNAASIQREPPLNAGHRPALIYQHEHTHTHTDSRLQPLSALLAYFSYF